MQLIYRGLPYHVNPGTGETIGNKTDNHKETIGMKMSYRGQSYNVNSKMAEAAEYGVTVCYRGIPYQTYRSIPQATRQAPVVLKFRGVAYLHV